MKNKLVRKNDILVKNEKILLWTKILRKIKNFILFYFCFFINFLIIYSNKNLYIKYVCDYQI